MRSVWLLECLQRKLGATNFDLFFSLLVALAQKARALLSNVQPSRLLATAFPALVHVLNITDKNLDKKLDKNLGKNLGENLDKI